MTAFLVKLHQGSSESAEKERHLSFELLKRRYVNKVRPSCEDEV